ncbi:MAG: chemotaxis protein CheB [Steroidobacteraceae bacterium]
MYKRDIVLIGASAGGLSALSKLLPRLPPDLAAAVFVTVHLSPHTPTQLPDILRRVASLTVVAASDGAPIRSGSVTVAVADHHLLLEPDCVRLTRGPRESRARPSIDAMFRSAALHFGPRCIGVVLTGMLDDGTAGLWAVKDRGGIAVVQSPQEAEYPSMPSSAIQHVEVDHIVKLADIPALLASLTQQAVDPAAGRQARRSLSIESSIAAGENPLAAGITSLGVLSPNTCPHCHGAMFQIKEGSFTRYRCHTGHAFAPKSLMADLDITIDEGLWSVLRAIDERLFLLRELQSDANARGDTHAAQEYARQAEDAQLRANDIRRLLLDPAALPHRVA